MNLPKNIIPCPVCKVRSEYNAYKDKQAHSKKWTNKFICPACHTRLTQRWSTIISSWFVIAFVGYLTLFTDFEYSLVILLLAILGMFLLLYSGLIFKVEENA